MKWQLRLAPQEDEQATELAPRHAVSKNAGVRRGLRLLAIVERLAQEGEILLVQRKGKKQKAVEVWLI